MHTSIVQKKLITKMWKHLQGHKNGSVKVINLKEYLLAILGISSAYLTNNSSDYPKFDNESRKISFKAIGYFDSQGEL